MKIKQRFFRTIPTIIVIIVVIIFICFMLCWRIKCDDDDDIYIYCSHVSIREPIQTVAR